MLWFILGVYVGGGIVNMVATECIVTDENGDAIESPWNWSDKLVSFFGWPYVLVAVIASESGQE